MKSLFVHRFRDVFFSVALLEERYIAWGDLPKVGEKKVNVFNLLGLVHKRTYIRNELRGVMIVQDVHVHPMASTCQKGLFVFFFIDTLPNASQHESPRVNGLKIPSWHLHYQ